jgi:hypothetical protein
MILDLIGSVLLYLVVSAGLAWPVAARLSCSASERLLASSFLSLVAVYLFAWAVYVWDLPLVALYALPVATIVGLALNWRGAAQTCRDREVRNLLSQQMIVTGWCIGWLALVVTYSGGGWAGDWFEHWQRTTFFLEQGPRNHLFHGFDSLTSRPPLANIVTGAFMWLTAVDFPHYQLATTFFSSLAFLPAALLANRLGDRSSSKVLALLFMVSPMFVQNTTFAWTKLPSAFFSLTAVYFFLQRDRAVPAAGVLCALALAAALLAHYSAGPYAIVLAAAWIVLGWTRRSGLGWWRETALATVSGIALLATWFTWAFHEYGVAGTLFTNTTVTTKAPTVAAQVLSAALNLRDTLIPHFLRDVDYQFIAQSSPWGWWRDWFFQLYQVNLLLAFGSTTWLVVLMALIKYVRGLSLGSRMITGFAIASTIAIGVAVHSARDVWGLAHICLQPLVLAGLAFVAARWHALSAFWRRVVVGGAVVDLVLGIVLQFGAQSFLLDDWLAPDRPAIETLQSYSKVAGINLSAKAYFQFTFFGDSFSAWKLIVLLVLLAVLGLALLRTRPQIAKQP